MGEDEFFPADDALASMRDEVLQRENPFPIDGKFEVELASQRDEAIRAGAPASVKWIYFRSPEWTWEQLCGREGWLLIDPDSGDQFDFVMTVLN